MVKLIAFTCAKTLGPTVTLTGIVTESPVVLNINCPLKVPAANPLPGKRLGLMDMLTVDGAVPLRADAVNQLPPSAVDATIVQLKVPVPAFLIWKDWAAGAPALVASEKLSCPGKLSKYAADPDAITVSVTGTVSAMSCWKY